ncbi:Hypothetical predicted protein [Octopus vulgaris]|uniref:Uncharacterized protein n=1 Tax=Octopus vulgaris TaxID=6645 RepID=A0AA36F2T0_OCTVU|nr:Hypothetical predicted protein [Octopus vulgaris]
MGLFQETPGVFSRDGASDIAIVTYTASYKLYYGRLRSYVHNIHRVFGMRTHDGDFYTGVSAMNKGAEDTTTTITLSLLIDPTVENDMTCRRTASSLYLTPYVGVCKMTLINGIYGRCGDIGNREKYYYPKRRYLEINLHTADLVRAVTLDD